MADNERKPESNRMAWIIGVTAGSMLAGMVAKEGWNRLTEDSKAAKVVAASDAGALEEAYHRRSPNVSGDAHDIAAKISQQLKLTKDETLKLEVWTLVKFDLKGEFFPQVDKAVYSDYSRDDLAKAMGVGLANLDKGALTKDEAKSVKKRIHDIVKAKELLHPARLDTNALSEKLQADQRSQTNSYQQRMRNK